MPPDEDKSLLKEKEIKKMWVLRVIADGIEKIRCDFNEYADMVELQNILTETIVTKNWSISIEREDY